MRFAGLVLMAILGGGCASAPLPSTHNALLKQILSPREGFKGLTNQVCVNYENGKCVPDVIEYDLNDAETRIRLSDLGFRCDVAGKGYYICRDKPGFCRREYDVVKRFLGIETSRTPVYSYLDINERYQFLIDARARCRSHQVLRAAQP